MEKDFGKERLRWDRIEMKLEGGRKFKAINCVIFVPPLIFWPGRCDDFAPKNKPLINVSISMFLVIVYQIFKKSLFC